MNDGALVIRWYDGDSPKYSWYIRGLRVDGSFYGEVRSIFDAPRASDGASGVGSFIKGQIAAAQMVRVRELMALIRSCPTIEIQGGQVGVVGERSVGQPVVIFRYGADDADSPAHAAFRELVEILRPHIESIYPKLSEI